MTRLGLSLGVLALCMCAGVGHFAAHAVNLRKVTVAKKEKAKEYEVPYFYRNQYPTYHGGKPYEPPEEFVINEGSTPCDGDDEATIAQKHQRQEQDAAQKIRAVAPPDNPLEGVTGKKLDKIKQLSARAKQATSGGAGILQEYPSITVGIAALVLLIGCILIVIHCDCCGCWESCGFWTGLILTAFSLMWITYMYRQSAKPDASLALDSLFSSCGPLEGTQPVIGPCLLKIKGVNAGEITLWD